MIDTTAKRIVYGLSRKYGTQATLYKLTESTTDYTTGLKTRATSSLSLRRVVPLANQQRRAIYESGAYLQQSRAYTWKGGQGADVNSRSFMVMGEDLRTWQPDVHQWLVFDGLQYEIAEVERVGSNVAYILNCRAVSIQDLGVEDSGLVWGEIPLVWGESQLVWQ